MRAFGLRGGADTVLASAMESPMELLLLLVLSDFRSTLLCEPGARRAGNPLPAANEDREAVPPGEGFPGPARAHEAAGPPPS